MKVIYVAGKYRGKTESEVFDNIIKAREVAIKLWQRGYAVVCPHTNSMFMGSLISDTGFLEGDLEIVARCDAIYMLDNWRDSEGAQAELRLAVDRKLEILYEENDE